MSLLDCCRLCLKDLTDLNQDEEGHFYCRESMVGDRLLQRVIEECFEILFTDNESIAKVCGNCYDDVMFVDKIRERVRVTDAAIKRYYAQLDIKPDVEFLEEVTSNEILPDLPNFAMNNVIFEDSDADSPQSEVLSEEEDSKHIEYVVLDTGRERKNRKVKQELQDSESDEEEIVEPVKRRRKRPPKANANKKGSVKCYICKTDYDSLTELDKHLPTHIGIIAPKCDLCNEELTTVRHLNMHLQRTHFRKGKRIPCDQCQSEGITREFSSTNKLQDHVKRVHEGIIETPERKFVCTYCGKNFARASSLKVHENIHTKAVLFKCPHCTTFSTTCRSGLTRHLRVHTAEKPFKCDLCDAQFAQSNGLNAHKVNRHNEDRPFVCKLCGDIARFKTKYTLAIHMKIHEKKGRVQRGSRKETIETPADRQLKCDFCPAVYYKEKFLCKHILANHPTENIPMIQCELCDKQNKQVFFLTAKEKETHLGYHVSMSKIPQKERACKDCGKVFQTLDALKRHRESHFSNDCDKCGKTYKGRAALRRHYLTVHCEIRPYKCDKCDASYGQFTQLTAHIKNHHQ